MTEHPTSVCSYIVSLLTMFPNSKIVNSTIPNIKKGTGAIVPGSTLGTALLLLLLLCPWSPVPLWHGASTVVDPRVLLPVIERRIL